MTPQAFVYAARSDSSRATGNRGFVHGPRVAGWLMDPADPATWAVAPLRYSRHAQERAAERGLPTPAHLPAGSRLADLDKSEVGV